MTMIRLFFSAGGESGSSWQAALLLGPASTSRPLPFLFLYSSLDFEFLVERALKLGSVAIFKGDVRPSKHLSREMEELVLHSKASKNGSTVLVSMPL